MAVKVLNVEKSGKEENETEKGHDKWGYDQGYIKDGTMQVRDSKLKGLQMLRSRSKRLIHEPRNWRTGLCFLLQVENRQMELGLKASLREAEVAPAVVAPVESRKKEYDDIVAEHMLEIIPYDD
nr:hypothetical protein [Tanacetum cinerariifolium]